MSKVGIMLNCIGTVLSLISFIRVDKNSIGTWGEIASRKKNYNIEAPLIWLGIVMIIAGAFLQCMF